MFFHGTPYSPKEAKWPGWKFYASIDMSPTNNIWQDAPAFFEYITRCQSFLQMGKPDNDFLVYLPVYDLHIVALADVQLRRVYWSPGRSWNRRRTPQLTARPERQLRSPRMPRLTKHRSKKISYRLIPIPMTNRYPEFSLRCKCSL